MTFYESINIYCSGFGEKEKLLPESNNQHKSG